MNGQAAPKSSDFLQGKTALIRLLFVGFDHEAPRAPAWQLARHLFSPSSRQFPLFLTSIPQRKICLRS
jgi:hypothetical protein